MSAGSTQLRAERERIVREHMESENEHDFDTTLRTFRHPRYEIIATGQVMDGPEAVMTYYEQTRTAFPDQRNRLIALHHADDAVIVEFDLMGTHRGSLYGETPTNRDFTARMAAFFLFDGEDLICERVYNDMGTILSQLGLLPGTVPSSA